MKVCHLTSVHDQHDVRIFHKECTSLARLYETHLVVASGKDGILNGVHIHGVETRITSRLLRIWLVVNKVYQKALELDCDVYHIHDPELLRITGKLLRKGKKVVYDVHEDVPRQIMGKYWIPILFRKLISVIFEYYENNKASKLSYICTSTPHIRDRFLKVNPNSIDVNNYPILADDFNLENKTGKGNEFCYVGGIDNNRGITQLTGVFGRVNAVLNLAGEITPKSYRRYLSRLHGWSNVSYLGFIGREEVRKVMSRSVAGFVTLKPLVNYMDALPVKMFEYMSMGLPVIASNFPLWKSIIQDNDCGICVDPTNEDDIINAVNEILKDPVRAAEMGENGRKLVYKRFHWAMEQKKLLSFYENIRISLRISTEVIESRKLKLLMLSDHLSTHTQNWVKSLAEHGLDIMIFSLSSGDEDYYSNFPNIKVVGRRYGNWIVRSENFFRKALYFLSIFRLTKLINEFKPDIVHAHYATSYGSLGALTSFHPLIISVWGADVFDFPNNFIKKGLLRYNLKRADKVLSTSHVLARETNKYVSVPIDVTPFGIDIDKFSPMKVKSVFPKGSFVVGTIKALEQKYGVAYLIRAFKLLCDKYKDAPLYLLIVGTGSKEEELKELTRSLNIENRTIFTGKVPHHNVPSYMNMLDIYVAVSTLDSESFGVAILEASSCEIPVIVSRVGGLPEVVEEEVTGLIVNKRDVEGTFRALDRLYNDGELRKRMGKAGRIRVTEKYNWNVCVERMMTIYEATQSTGNPRMPVNSALIGISAQVNGSPAAEYKELNK